MKYILDTDIISYYLKGSDKEVVENLEQSNPSNICTTIINYSEILFGIYYKYGTKNRHLITIKNFFNSIRVFSFDKKSAEFFSMIKSTLKKDGEIIADLDLIIASITIAHDFTLISHNTKHFSRIKNLKLEDWTVQHP